jgi:hypothetical protein
MYDNYNYPLGSDNEDSPWNREPIPEREFDVTISQSLSKGVIVHTDKYQPEVDKEVGAVYADTSDTEWAEVYKEEHYTPLQLIEMLKERCEKELKELESIKETDKPYSLMVEKRKLKHLVEECSEWSNDETEIFEG